MYDAHFSTSLKSHYCTCECAQQAKLSILVFLTNSQKKMLKKDYWASEASPTLGCSIETPRDIYMSVCMSTVCQNTCMFKVSFGQLKPAGDTRVIHFDYTLEQL